MENQELEYCPVCCIGLNNEEVKTQHCTNCRSSWETNEQGEIEVT